MTNSNDRHGFQLFDLASDSVQWQSKSSSSLKICDTARKSDRPGVGSSSGDKPPTVSLLTPEGGPYPLESKYDCCAFVIHCATHDKVAVSKRADVQAAWLPFTPLPPNKTSKEGAMIGALIALSGGHQAQFLELKKKPPFGEFTCMHMLRVQLPHTLRFITRLVFYARLDPSYSHFKCCVDTKRIEWMSISLVIENKMKHVWGPELASFCRLATSHFSQRITEYTLDKAFTFVPRDPPRNPQESILKSIKITEKDIERIYLDWIEHCFPSSHMSIDSFKHYMRKYGFENNEKRLDGLFKAFNNQGDGSLSFHEFLIGVALMEPLSQHDELRTKFIFRFYDVDNDGYLNKNEVANMIADLHANESKEELAKRTSSEAHHLPTKLVNGQETVCLEDFCHAVGLHKFRGTHRLCRASKPIFPQISRAIAERNLISGAKIPMTDLLLNRAHKGVCNKCLDIKYQLSSHKVQLSATGRVISASQLTEEVEGEHMKSAYKHSLEVVFNRKHVANVLMEKVRAFNQEKGTNVKPNGLMTSHPEQLFSMIQELCIQVTHLVKHEKKCHKVASPCYIIADVHGNLEDLLSLEKSLWNRAPCVGANYLFLGDYVDRGRWSLEVALYLFAFKCLCPSNVTLLRGNHEVRELQTQYTYKNECLQKYGKDLGIKIWETTNALFDLLPVSAVIDGAIFCAHGGIPRSCQKVDQICNIPQELKDPQQQSASAWEILWSDPVHMPQFNDIADIGDNSDEDIENGYIYNPKRGTAYLFNDIAAENFLKNNELSYIVRGHEVPQRGFTFHFGNKCATIFSCSHYCGNNNECATILCDNPTLRIIQLDTVNNAPATD